MSTPSSWQQWASDRQRKDLFFVCTTDVPTTKPPQPARSTGKSQLEAKATIPKPPQHPPPPISSSNQLKAETSTSHHPRTTAAPSKSASQLPTPAKKRPETTDVVARRLIGRALGINLAKRVGDGEGERFGINTKTKRQPQPQTESAAELELVKKMEEVDISWASERVC